MMALVTGSLVIVLALGMTKPGRAIDAATQRFMLYYAGVFALIGLTASVAVGLVATDRIIMTPGHRVMAQAVHRAVSFGALAFLVIHIVTEILAQRSHAIDSVIPFLSPYRTFYIGLGTIASDLILLIVVTSIFRKRFTARSKAWRWRAIHYSSYLAFVLGVMHGLLGGRAAKPYVDWSYGFAIALTALAVLVRFLAISLRPKERVGTPRGADRAVGGLGYSGTSPLRTAALNTAQAQLGGTIQVLPSTAGAQGAGFGALDGRSRAALPAAPGWHSASGPLPALMPLSAPVYGVGMTAGTGGYPYAPGAPQPPLLDPGMAARADRLPWHEPEYDGPPRFVGAPRKHVPQDDLSSYPYAPASYQPAAGDRGTGPMPRLGPPPRLGSGPMPRVDSGPMPRLGTGPMPRADSGPMPRPGPVSGPRAGSGPMPRLGTGPLPRADTGPLPRADTSPIPRIGAGPAPWPGTGPMPRADSGPMPRLGTGPLPRAADGSRPPAGPGPAPRLPVNPGPRSPTGPRPAVGLVPGPDPLSGPRTGPMPAAAPRRSRRADDTNPRSRDIPGRAGGDEWR
jgi:DMSO/TMAO reductase YedYZ heme-binding membrane subunit